MREFRSRGLETRGPLVGIGGLGVVARLVLHDPVVLHLPFGPSLAIAMLWLGLPSSGGAQQGDTTLVCTGELVSRVDIQASPPPFSGAAKRWRAAANAIGLHHATTRFGVISAFLSLAPGRPCTAFRRAESERVLRAQPFLAAASVRATSGDSLAWFELHLEQARLAVKQLAGR